MLLVVENKKEDNTLVESNIVGSVEFDRAVWVINENGQIVAYQLIDTEGNTVRVYVETGHPVERMVSMMEDTSGCKT